MRSPPPFPSGKLAQWEEYVVQFAFERQEEGEVSLTVGEKVTLTLTLALALGLALALALALNLTLTRC